MLSQSEDFFKNPTSTLVTVFSWTYGDKVALIGDACHAIVPLLWTRYECCFEDISILCNEMMKNMRGLGDCFPEYEKSRKPNADAIAELYRNFLEMSSKLRMINFYQKK
jgi:kynurenine 3-monooxygenase